MLKFIPAFLFLFSSCFTQSHAQSWTSASSYDGDSRHHPITFSGIGYGFVIAGQSNLGEYLEDVYRYDSQTDTWDQLADFPGGPRGFSYGVSDGEFAFVGFGSYGSDFPNDWWKYDIANNEWTALANFPSGGRNHPALIIVEDKIYMGLGSNNMGNLGDWWQYDITTNVWIEKAEFEFGNRHHPFYFGIDGIPYVGFGHGNSVNGNFSIFNDFYKYEASNDSWVTLNNFPGEGRVAGTQFSFDGKGYVLSGDGDDHGPLDSGEFWEYNPNTDSWTSLNSHPGGARWAPGSFVIDCDIYLTSGYEGDTDLYYNDLLKYQTGLQCGCTDDAAFNYDSDADVDDGSCDYCEITSSQTSVCKGTSVSLEANSTLDLLWPDGSSSDSYSPIIYNDITVNVLFFESGDLVCEDSIDIISIIPIIPTITQVGSTLLSSSAIFYQWYYEGVELEGENSQSITNVLPGEYSVNIKDKNGCYSFSESFSSDSEESWDCQNNECVDLGFGTGIYFTQENCEQQCHSSTSISDYFINKKLLNRFNIYGQKVKTSDKVQILIYSDGSVEKKVIIE